MLEIQEENSIFENQSTREWLAIKLDTEKIRETNKSQINELYKTTLGLDFLLVWTIFEKRLLIKNRDMHNYTSQDRIHESSRNLNYILNDEMRGILEEFIRRFKDKVKLGQLCAKKNKCKGSCYGNSCKMYKLVSRYDLSGNTEYTIEEKKYILMYIVNRYRNNMFHGGKGIGDWVSKYGKQINNCIKIMKWLVDEKGKIESK